MASSSGTSSGSTTLLQNSGSEGDLQLLMDERKRRRMLSNRESARRSRMRKQKHLDGLMSQVNQLRRDNGDILTAYKLTTQQYIAVEAENSVLRTQMAELNSRLQSLSEILEYINSVNPAAVGGYLGDAAPPPLPMGDSFMNPWGLLAVSQQIMASTDMFIK